MLSAAYLRPGSPLLAERARGALLFFGSVCFTTFGIAAIATVLGYWPVLPFAGAEMLLLGWALKIEHGKAPSSASTSKSRSAK